MSRKIEAEMQSYERECGNLKQKLDSFLEEKRKIVLRKKDTATINVKIGEVRERISDVSTILLPELKQQLEKAKEAEAEETRLKTIQNLLEEDMKQLGEAKNCIAKLVECYDVVKECVEKINGIDIRHGQITSKLSSLRGTRPEGYLWEPLIFPSEFDELARLGVRQSSWLQKWRKK